MIQEKMTTCAIICLTPNIYRDYILMYLDWAKSQKFTTFIYSCEDFTNIENMFIVNSVNDLDLMLYDILIFPNIQESQPFQRHANRILNLPQNIDFAFHTHFIDSWETKLKLFQRRSVILANPERIQICVTDESTILDSRLDYHYQVFINPQKKLENATYYNNPDMESMYTIASCCDYVDDKTLSFNCFVSYLKDALDNHIIFRKFTVNDKFENRDKLTELTNQLQEMNQVQEMNNLLKIATNPFQFKYLHQMWLSKNPLRPTNMYHQKNQLKWKELNPNLEYRMWHMEEVINLIKQHYDEKTLDFFESLEPFICKCDLARLLVLNIYGGVYVDCDFVPIKPINEWQVKYDESGVMVFREIYEHSHTRVCNGLFGIENPNNEFLSSLIQEIINPTNQENDVLFKTGPQLFYNILNLYYPNIIIQNGGYIMPVTNQHTLSQDFNTSTHSCWAYTEWNTGSNWGLGTLQRALIINTSNATNLENSPNNNDPWFIVFICTTVLLILTILFWSIMEVRLRKKRHSQTK